MKLQTEHLLVCVRGLNNILAEIIIKPGELIEISLGRANIVSAIMKDWT